jgi:orotate phosphoribosyltransferase
VTDTLLAAAIQDLGVIRFGPNQQNKNDSPSCVFDPRRLLSAPALLEHIGSRLAAVVRKRCHGSALVGMATSGIAWAAIASLKSGLPMLYIRKSVEETVSDKLLEGIPPPDRRLVLIDDLLFAGEGKRKALDILSGQGYEVTDVVVIIDRQLQRRTDGPRLQDAYTLRLHSLITMDEIVDYLLETKRLDPTHLAWLIADYRLHARWDLPRFAAEH